MIVTRIASALAEISSAVLVVFLWIPVDAKLHGKPDDPVLLVAAAFAAIVHVLALLILWRHRKREVQWSRLYLDVALLAIFFLPAAICCGIFEFFRSSEAMSTGDVLIATAWDLAMFSLLMSTIGPARELNAAAAPQEAESTDNEDR